MSIQDITPEDSAVPIFLDPTPQEPPGDPFPTPTTDDVLREIIKMKIDHGIALTEDEITLIAGGA